MSDTLHPLDIVINLKQGGRQFITESHRHFDSLHYVLLFPYGDEGLGWHWEMKQNETITKNMSAAMYYSYLFQFRRGHFNLIVRSTKLFMEFCCVAWYKVNKLRLKWIRQNQASIRAEKYCGVIDAIHEHDTEDIGQRIILPATFYGGPRWYQIMF